MSHTPYYSHYRSSSLLHIANQIVNFELIWSFPLIGVGVLRVLDPTIIGVAILLALLPWFARLLVFGRLTQPSYITGGLLLLVAGALVSMWATYNPTESWPMLFTLLGSVSLFFAIANAFVSPKQIAGGLVIAAGVVTFYFVGQYAHFGYEGEVGWSANLGRITGAILPNLVIFVPHPNAVASFLEGAFLLSLILTWQSSHKVRFGWGLVTILIAYGLFISGSRGSWMGLAIAMGIWGLLLLPSRNLRLLVGGLGVVGVFAGLYFVILLMPQIQHISFLNSLQSTADSRLALYRNSLYLVGDYLFTGIGLGDVFALIYSRYQLLIFVPYLTYTHNLFLSVGLGFGLLGLIGLAWILIGFYLFFIRVEWVALRRKPLPLFRAASLGITAILIHGLTDAPQFSTPGWTMPMLFAMLGLAVAIGRPALFNSLEDGKTSGVVKPVWKWLWWTFLFMGVFATAVVFWRPLVSAWYANVGAVYQTWADLSPELDDTSRDTARQQAITYFERSLNLNPSQPVANRRFGMMALERYVFDVAVDYLSRAYQQEPGNQATLKALILAYTWSGQLNLAEQVFQQLDNQSDLVDELGVWSWWWNTQDRVDLAGYAHQMVQRLSTKD